MKRWISAALSAMALMSSCQGVSLEGISGALWGSGQGAESSSSPAASSQISAVPPEPIFDSVDDYPIVDGSTANLPLMARVMADTCGIPLEEAETLTVNTGTNASWNRLIYGDVDLLLVYEAPEETQKAIEDSCVELEVTPVGRDALVFLVNSGNALESLTQEQLRSIYVGETTNWAELGGIDHEIVPFQRNATSGSQTMFLKLLMKDTQPMDPPQELISGSMGQLVDSVATYDNSAGAIGFSVYYYAAMMYENPSLRMLAVDGVEPSRESIADASYPLLNDFFLAIRADDPLGSPARQLRDWLLSEEGRAAFEKSGYVPIF